MALDPVARAIQYLASSQLPDGEFRTIFRKGRTEPSPGVFVDDLVSDSSPFATSLILHSLGFVRDAEARVPKMIDQGCKFLLSEMDPGGLWRYWSSKNQLWPKQAIPPDLDDICCVSHVLKTNGYAIPNNRGIIRDSRDASGAFFTWLYKPDSLRKWILWARTGGKAFCYSDLIWQFTGKGDICAVVNANVVHYLGETVDTKRAIDYLLAMIREGSEERQIVFYWHKFSLYYMLSRALHSGVSGLAGARDAVVRRVMDARLSDGSFGDELLTAQAICSLLNFKAGDAKVLDQACLYLISTQKEDGSWRRIPMYGGPPVPDSFGSADLTTGMCLEALARCRARV